MFLVNDSILCVRALVIWIELIIDWRLSKFLSELGHFILITYTFIRWFLLWFEQFHGWQANIRFNEFWLLSLKQNGNNESSGTNEYFAYEECGVRNLWLFFSVKNRFELINLYEWFTKNCYRRIFFICSNESEIHMENVCWDGKNFDRYNWLRTTISLPAIPVSLSRLRFCVFSVKKYSIGLNE